MFSLLTIPRGGPRDEAEGDDAAPVFGIVIRPTRTAPTAPVHPLPVPARALRSAGAP